MTGCLVGWDNCPTHLPGFCPNLPKVLEPFKGWAGVGRLPFADMQSFSVNL